MFLHIHNHAIMRCVQVHKTKKQNAFFHCVTSNSIVKLNISKDTSKKHEEDEGKKGSEKIMTHFCVLFLLESFVWKNTEE